MKNNYLLIFLIILGIILFYNLGFSLKEGLTNEEIYKLIRNEQDIDSIKSRLNERGVSGENIFLDNLDIDSVSSKEDLLNNLILNDLYAPKTSMVPPVCPKCPISCPDKTKCPPCPPCGRCPESTFTCKKVQKKSNETINEDQSGEINDENAECEGDDCENISDDNDNDNDNNGNNNNNLSNQNNNNLSNQNNNNLSNENSNLRKNTDLQSYCVQNCKGQQLINECYQCVSFFNNSNNSMGNSENNSNNMYCHSEVANVWNEN